MEKIKKGLQSGAGYVLLLFNKDGSTEVFAEGYLSPDEILEACAVLIEKEMGKQVLIVRTRRSSETKQETEAKPTAPGVAG